MNQFRTVLLIFVVIFGVVIVACCIAAICIDIRQSSSSLLPANAPIPPVILHTFKVGKETSKVQCCICLEEFGEKDVTEGQCGHRFHSQCVLSWLSKDKAQSCPLCRETFTTDVP